MNNLFLYQKFYRIGIIPVVSQFEKISRSARSEAADLLKESRSVRRLAASAA